MSDSLVIDMDDFGCAHKISDMCMSNDCRDKLDQFHYANPNFKATLFAIPNEMTRELAEWCKANSSWIELAVHGIGHTSNYECEKMTYEEFDKQIKQLQPMLDTYFVKGFRAPGWQISDDIYAWLLDNNWWVADQEYNNHRRPERLPAYVNNNGTFYTPHGDSGDIIGKHYHVWDVGKVGSNPNGVYEASDQILADIEGVQEFKFVSEAVLEAEQ